MLFATKSQQNAQPFEQCEDYDFITSHFSSKNVLNQKRNSLAGYFFQKIRHSECNFTGMEAYFSVAQTFWLCGASEATNVAERLAEAQKKANNGSTPNAALNSYIDLIYPSMYYGMERIINKKHKVIANTHSAVNNIYLNGIRIAALGDKGDLQYYLTDQVDSVKLVINGDGEVVNKFEYLPYGETWITEGDGLNAPKYNSQELDRETSFYFYNARYYDPEIARFVTADNVVDGELSSVGWNRYAYVKGNPVVYKDPSGNYLCGTGKSESCLEAYEPETTKRSITLEQAKENLESRKFVLNNLDNPGVGIGMALTGSGKSSEQYEASAKKGAALWNVFAGFSGVVAKGISKLTNLNKKGNNTVKNVTQGTTGGGTVTPVKVNNVKAKSTDTGRFGSLKNNESNKTYEIRDGVRRSIANFYLGNKLINAEVVDRKTNKVIERKLLDIESLLSPKEKLDISNKKKNDRYFDIQNSIEKGDKLPPIEVYRGGHGTKIKDVEFDDIGE
jgi:RHS repeat-associated protein